MEIAALIVAAGRGARAADPASGNRGGAGQQPKQYVDLAGKSVLQRTLTQFLEHPRVACVQVVIHKDDTDRYAEVVGNLSQERMRLPVFGGDSRQASVLAGLCALRDQGIDAVLIHDAARPFVTADTVDSIIAELEAGRCAIAAAPLADTLKRSGTDGRIETTIPRDDHWLAQTPQGFPFSDILKAHELAAATDQHTFTDDAAVAEWAGLDVAIVVSSADNFKLTTPEDMQLATCKLQSRENTQPSTETRVGNGFDVHRFANGDHVWLGGIKIPHTHRLDGHSDADVVLHALTDAILGALGDGDIGAHFPPTDPKWKGAASDIFLVDAVKRVAARGGRITNVDMTVLAETPKIGPHRDAMRKRVSSILGIRVDRIGVKATTTEGLGFTGRKEGIAAIATVTLVLPI